MSTSHKDAHTNDNNMHEVKGFPSALIGYFYQKTIRGVSEWVRSFRLPNAISAANGYDAPPTEVDLDVYAIESPELDINGIVWQSGTTVRFTFSAGYDSALYAVNSFLTISGEDSFPVHDGVWVITTVNASYLEVTNAGVTDGASDVASGSAAEGYVTHEDFDPENLANSQSIPRQGIVKYDNNVDLWFGNAFQEGDEYYNEELKNKVVHDGVNTVANAQLKQVTSSLSAAQLLAGTQVEIVPSPGAGYAIEVHSLSVDYTHNGTSYDVGKVIQARIDTASVDQFATGNILIGVVSVFVKGIKGISIAFSSLIADKSLKIGADAASTVGNGTAEVYTTYRLIKV